MGPDQGAGRLDCNNLVSEPKMAESQRLQRLEQQISSLSMGQERMLKQMNDLFLLMQNRKETGASNPDRNEIAPSGEILTKPERSDFPIFDDHEDPTTWIYKPKQTLELQEIAGTETVSVVPYHQEDDGQIWIQIKKKLKSQIEWKGIKKEMLLCFESALYKDCSINLGKLRQMKILRNYKSRFKKLLSKVSKMEKMISKMEIVELLRRDSKDRLRVNKTLVILLFKLESVREVDFKVRDCKKSAVKRI